MAICLSGVQGRINHKANEVAAYGPPFLGDPKIWGSLKAHYRVSFSRMYTPLIRQFWTRPYPLVNEGQEEGRAP